MSLEGSILLCNSNGTLFNDVMKDHAELLESAYAEYKALNGIDDPEGLNEKYSRLKTESKKDKSKIRALKEHLKLYLQIQTDEKHKMVHKKQNGLDEMFSDAESAGIKVQLYANAPQEYLSHVGQRTNTSHRIDKTYSTLDEKLGSRNGIAVDKDTRTLGYIARDNDGKVVAYISHKEKEAELGAKAYGLGVHIDSKMKENYKVVKGKHGDIIKVKSLKYVVRAVKEYKAGKNGKNYQSNKKQKAKKKG